MDHWGAAQCCKFLLEGWHVLADVRRFAAGLNLQRGLGEGPKPGEHETISIGSKVSFKRANSEDLAGEQFLKEWLGDYEFTELEGLEDNRAWLNFPSEKLVPDNR